MNVEQIDKEIVQISSSNIETSYLITLFESFVVNHIYVFENEQMWIIRLEDFAKYKSCPEKAKKQICYLKEDSVKNIENDYEFIPVVNKEGKIIKEYCRQIVSRNNINGIKAQRELEKNGLLRKYVKETGYRRIKIFGTDWIKKYFQRQLEDNYFVECLDEADLILHENEIEATTLKMRGYNSEYIYDLFEKIVLIYNFVNWGKKQDIPIYYFPVPKEDDYDMFLETEKKRMNNKISFQEMCDNVNFYSRDFQDLFGEFYSEEYINDLRNLPEVLEIDNQFFYSDLKSNLVNVENGIRNTIMQSKYCKGRVVFWGKCTVFGYAVEDKYTIPSLFQKKLIEFGESSIQVVNRGVWGLSTKQLFTSILKSHPQYGDFYIILSDDLKKEEIRILLKNGFYGVERLKVENNRKYDIVFDKPFHINYRGNEILEEIIFQYTKEAIKNNYSNFIGEQKLWEDEWNDVLGRKSQENFARYLRNINKDNSDNGIIVMNANPFTVGHKHLIEYSRKKVNLLYVMVVQEENGMFTFKERYEMVKSVCEQYNNVIVLNSGVYITKKTFPDYFDKKDKVIGKLDVDETFFFNKIVDALKIKTRFLGEEPIDPITNAYNQLLVKESLVNNIECDIIPRLMINNQVVSARKVRDAINRGEKENIKKLVPREVFKIIEKRITKWKY